ncbi:MAG: M24 family metallopeptidase, partial [Candidatus Omnitrophota bacterium]|nr:M24 family metallopeptidase [Candidatus Omnitrophota bacterium]
MIPIKSTREIALMRNASGIVFRAIKALMGYVKPGLMTKDIDEMMKRLILDNGGRPAFFGYKGFPGNTCISLNNELV